jgi:hypothetical protein
MDEPLSRCFFYQKQHFKTKIQTGEKTTSYRTWLPCTLARFERHLAKNELVSFGNQKERWGICRLISISPFRLHSMTQEDVRKDGGGVMSPQTFLKKYFRKLFDDKETRLVRVQYEYVRDYLPADSLLLMARTKNTKEHKVRMLKKKLKDLEKARQQEAARTTQTQEKVSFSS